MLQNMRRAFGPGYRNPLAKVAAAAATETQGCPSSQSAAKRQKTERAQKKPE